MPSATLGAALASIPAASSPRVFCVLMNQYVDEALPHVLRRVAW